MNLKVRFWKTTHFMLFKSNVTWGGSIKSDFLKNLLIRKLIFNLIKSFWVSQKYFETDPKYQGKGVSDNVFIKKRKSILYIYAMECFGERKNLRCLLVYISTLECLSHVCIYSNVIG